MPTGSQATHAGYDTDILIELLGEWVLALGKGCGNVSFCPKVAITDTDVKEHGALLRIWPSVYLLLCKFHVRNSWSNKRKTLIKMGNSVNFGKQQVVVHLKLLHKGMYLTFSIRTLLK